MQPLPFCLPSLFFLSLTLFSSSFPSLVCFSGFVNFLFFASWWSKGCDNFRWVLFSKIPARNKWQWINPKLSFSMSKQSFSSPLAKIKEKKRDLVCPWKEWLTCNELGSVSLAVLEAEVQPRNWMTWSHLILNKKGQTACRLSKQLAPVVEYADNF